MKPAIECELTQEQRNDPAAAQRYKDTRNAIHRQIYGRVLTRVYRGDKAKADKDLFKQIETGSDHVLVIELDQWGEDLIRHTEQGRASAERASAASAA
jgi:hypothetical protein